MRAPLPLSIFTPIVNFAPIALNNRPWSVGIGPVSQWVLLGLAQGFKFVHLVSRREFVIRGMAKADVDVPTVTFKGNVSCIIIVSKEGKLSTNFEYC